MWFRWLLVSVAFPLLPFALSLFFRCFADETSPHSPPILWNAELPFFTLMMCVANVQTFFALQELKTARSDVFETLLKVVVASCVVAGLSTLLLSQYYWALHVQQISEKRQLTLGQAQLVFAAVQLVLGAVMRYSENRFGRSPAPRP